MSLKAFHVLFIGASAIVAFFFAGWCLRGPPPGLDAGRIVAGLGSIAGGLLLVAYEAWFLRKMRGLP